MTPDELFVLGCLFGALFVLIIWWVAVWPLKGNAYIGKTMIMSSGNGEPQERKIIAYGQDNKVATVEKPWDVEPDSGAEFLFKNCTPAEINASGHVEPSEPWPTSEKED